MALSEGHHHVLEGHQFAAVRQIGLRQINRKRRQDFDPGARSLQRLGAVADQAIGETAFARGAVLGALLLPVHEHLVFDALGAPGAAGLVAARLLLPRFLKRAFCIAQGVRGVTEVGFGAVARGLSRFGKGGPRAAEYGDADGR